MVECARYKHVLKTLMEKRIGSESLPTVTQNVLQTVRPSFFADVETGWLSHHLHAHAPCMAAPDCRHSSRSESVSTASGSAAVPRISRSATPNCTPPSTSRSSRPSTAEPLAARPSPYALQLVELDESVYTDTPPSPASASADWRSAPGAIGPLESRQRFFRLCRQPSKHKAVPEGTSLPQLRAAGRHRSARAEVGEQSVSCTAVSASTAELNAWCEYIRACRSSAIVPHPAMTTQSSTAWQLQRRGFGSKQAVALSCTVSALRTLRTLNLSECRLDSAAVIKWCEVRGASLQLVAAACRRRK